ncbi:MAG: metal-dependent hydrolase [Flavobacteriaceae bacterium]|nr:metal-dependent hydrolase [Flavobacteriaceae bacterium]
MDSLTQIVLGAACGEAILGKKIGNKALLFGAIGGTIPDLDVFVGELIYDSELQSMAFHRGIMHSLVFALIAGFILGWITYIGYDTGPRKGTTTRKDWISLFLLALFTHPLLDSLTPYGTQLFAPFSDYRVSLNTIAVADFFYTLPFLLLLVWLMFYNRKSRRRRSILTAAFIISCGYLLFTVGNKLLMDRIFKKSLANSEIEYKRLNTLPILFTNFLWYGMAETEDHFYLGYYSWFDDENTIQSWEKVPKNHNLLPAQQEQISVLSWFSDELYVVEKLNENSYKYIDLRFPRPLETGKTSSVFTFKLTEQGNDFKFEQYKGDPPSRGDLTRLYQRIIGKK